MTFRTSLSRFALIVLLTAAAPLLGGCSVSGDITSFGGSVPEPDPDAVTLVTITATNVGPLDASTPYSTKTIEAALPGFTTQPIQMAEEDRTLWTTGVFHDGFQVLQVLKGNGGKIGEIHGVSPDIEGPNGERLGMRFDKTGIPVSRCRVGRNLWRDMAICPARGAPNVELIFAVTQYDGPFDRLPPRDELDSATLQRIVWTAPKS
ncbi:uncharacterized protein DUF1131 [Breoghania corrubedonensis]|uniref:Uncharacterized protein DUF1131 n=1 Tax=Breoghania corrubedonensis TaxID=665038 RepID=A0A2T5UWC0_9HYPH|nr:DUF1131 family protein [Breoghania corrubedonensis]PTW55782.1 uncharacterized protein DUF1131 [Breoghania corrubedonensis]